MSLSPPCTCPCSFFGDLAGHSTAAVLERLFQLEGEGVLQDMLSAVEAQEGGSWRRVIRVQEETPPHRPLMLAASEGTEQASQAPLRPLLEVIPSPMVMLDSTGPGRGGEAPAFTRMSQPDATDSTAAAGQGLLPGGSPPGSSTDAAASAPSAFGKLRSLLSIRRPTPDAEHIMAPGSPGESHLNAPCLGQPAVRVVCSSEHLPNSCFEGRKMCSLDVNEDNL